MVDPTPLSEETPHVMQTGRMSRLSRDPGERAADEATNLYVEREHESRKARFERSVRRAAQRDESQAGL